MLGHSVELCLLFVHVWHHWHVMLPDCIAMATCCSFLTDFKVVNVCAIPGVQLVRMTPFRSYVAVIGAAIAAIFARQLQLNNGMRTYISVRH